MKEFCDEVREKKALVPSARHRVCGSKSKKCSLPSDNLTEAQKRKLNGPCETYAINKPCDYKTFKAMPHDIAQVWLDYVQNRFGVSPSAIAGVLWSTEVTRVAATNYLSAHGFTTQAGLRASRDKMKMLQAWAEGDIKEEPAPVEEEPVLIEEAPQEIAEEPKQKPAPLDALVISERVSMELVGPWEAIRAELDRRFAGQRVALTVHADICRTKGDSIDG